MRAKCRALAYGARAADNSSMECNALVTELMASGIEHHLANRFEAAVDRYSRVLAMLPEHGDAWRMLGVVALQSSDNQAARCLLERAIRIDPNDDAAYSALGSAHESAGNLELAAEAYAAARAIDVTQDAAASGLARVALGLGRTADAVAIGEATVAGGTRDAGLYRTLGAAHLILHNFAAGAQALEASVRMRPHADAYACLGAAYLHLRRPDAAIRACEQALEIDPSHGLATVHLGIALTAQAAFSPAAAAFERAIELGVESARINLGSLQLLTGDYASGWPNFGWATAERRATPAFTALPMWDGTRCPGMRLLIWHEQGVGDTIQMARFIPLARARVGSVTFACPPGTTNLFRSVEGAETFVDMREPIRFESFDAWVPTIRLPLLFDITLETIPTAPYLHADPERVARFRPRLKADARGALSVGLVWSGNTEYPWNAERSCRLAELASLQDVDGIRLFALQQGPARNEQARADVQLVPINSELDDFADTAAVIAQLDLVISVDTSVAHLAGALGLPAWVLVCSRPSWRWQLKGRDSPWYPTLRLFRQSEDGAWGPVIVALTAALREFAHDSGVH